MSADPRLEGQPEATSYSVERLVRMCLEGELVLPDFQRPYRWKPAHRLDLLDSLYRGYPIGSLLLWQPPRWEGLVSNWGQDVSGEPLLTVPVRPGGGVLALVDGQQRAATLAVTLAPPEVAPAEWRMFFDTERLEFFYPTKRAPAAWDLPLSEVLDTLRFLDWMQRRPPVAGRDARLHAANTLVRQIRDYRIPAILVRARDPRVLRIVFDRINTRGVPLEATAVFDALHLPQPGVGGVREVARRLGALGFGAVRELEVLKAVMAVAGMDVTRDFRAQHRDDGDGPDLDAALNTAESVLRNVIQFLSLDAEIPHIQLLPYRSVLPVLVAVLHRHGGGPEVRAGLRRWLWMGSVYGFGWLGNADMRGFMASVRQNDWASARWGLERRLEKRREKAARQGQPAFGVSDRWDLNSAPTKVVACAMVADGPRDLAAGKLIPVREVIQALGSRAFREIDAGLEEDQRRTAVNRYFHAPEGPRPLAGGADSLGLSSQYIEPGPMWFERREELLAEVVRSFVERMTGE